VCCRRCCASGGGGARRADLGGSNDNSSERAKTEEEKGFPMMDISGERAGTERRHGRPSDREAGNDSCALQARGDARGVLTGTGARGRAAISVYRRAPREMGQPANVGRTELHWSARGRCPREKTRRPLQARTDNRDRSPR